MPLCENHLRRVCEGPLPDVFTVFAPRPSEETPRLSWLMHRLYGMSEQNDFFIEEGSNKLCFLLCHTKQYKKHVKKAQGSHWKAKATRNDLKLHYPVSNSFSFFLRKCNCERLGEGIGAVASMSALKRAIKSLLWVSL